MFTLTAKLMTAKLSCTDNQFAPHSQRLKAEQFIKLAAMLPD